ncbi:MAG: hypothetical protein NC037_04975, partial [Bacteroides sp.]|nr:hypothetical protein [[Eubacterium] siraeum]MCM1455864.1 hypothetical protein [Bacteroides sp.]
MQKQRNKLFKLIALLVIVAMLAALVAVSLVACNKGDDDDFSLSLDTIDAAALNQAISGGMGYISAHKQEYSTCYLNCNYSANNSNAYSLYSNNAQSYRLTVGISLFNDDDSDEEADYFTCQVMFFKSEQDAKDNLNDIKDNYPDTAIISQKGKLIIIESEAGAYDTILKARVAENSAENEQLKFYKTALKNELNTKNATVEASYST